MSGFSWRPHVNNFSAFLAVLYGFAQEIRSDRFLIASGGADVRKRHGKVANPDASAVGYALYADVWKKIRSGTTVEILPSFMAVRAADYVLTHVGIRQASF